MTAFILSILLALPAHGAVMQSSNFIVTAEDYNSAGTVATKSANFSTYADMPNVGGQLISFDFANCVGLPCMLFGNPPIAISSSATQVGPGGGVLNYAPTSGPVTVTVPPGIYDSTVAMTVTTPTNYPCQSAPEQLIPICDSGLGIDVGVSEEPHGSVTLSISYENIPLDPDKDEGKFIIARCDTDTGRWIPLPSTPDKINKRIEAISDHLSLFEVMQAAPPTSLSEFQAGPNPLRPALSESQMNFLVPANSRIRIYTITGELVNDFTAASDGTASWDGNNKSGRAVASGVYFVFVQGAGQEHTFKVAVER